MALELADIFREHGASYRRKYADKLLPSHRQAMWATPALAAQVQVLNAAAPRRSAGRSLAVLPARNFNIVITPAAIAIAPNVSTNRPKPGWRFSANYSCPFLILC